MDEIRLDKSDVTVEAIVLQCDDCTDPATHVVKVDFRSAGMAQEVGRYCLTCAVAASGRIREGLPTP